MDWAFFDDPCRGVRYNRNIVYRGADCSASSIWFPIVLQWNFYLTDIITVFGEPGLAISHTRFSVDDCPGAPDEYICGEDWSDTDVHPFVLYAGAKFMFGRNVGLTVRLGFPSISVGASFLL
jgi:hypothetical protein